MKIDKVIKIIASIGFLLITISLIVLWRSPATGYEPSIYTATPTVFWVGLIFSLVCGVGIVVQQIYTKKFEKSSLWVIGLILILLGYTALLSLSIVRGYALWCRADPLVHLRMTQDIIYTAHIDRWLFYPITHIYLAEVFSICDISPILLHKYIPFIFSLLFVAFMYLLAKAILPHKGQVILATVAGMAIMAPLHGWYLNMTPNCLANLVFPLALFLLVKSFTVGTVPWKILFIIMILLFPIFHPVPGIALVLILLTLWLPRRILGIPRKESSKAMSSAFNFNATASALLLVWVITWFSSFYIWDQMIRNVHIIITEGGLTHLMALIADLQYAEGYGYSVVVQFFKYYGGALIYIILTLVAFPIVRKRAFSDINSQNLLSLYGPLLVLALVITVLYFFKIGFGPLRMLVYMVIICTIFTGFMLHEILEKARSSHISNYAHKLAPLLVIIILIAVFMNSALKLYPSRYTLMANWQITRAEIAGTDWFFHNRDISMSLTGLEVDPNRLVYFLLPPAERKEHKIVERLPLVWHFGYDEHSALGESYVQNTYLAFSEAGRVAYRDVVPEVAEFRLLPSDFEKLEQDPSVDKLYSNGGFDAYYIHGQ